MYSSELRSTARSTILVRSSGGRRWVGVPRFRRFATCFVVVSKMSYNSRTCGELSEHGVGEVGAHAYGGQIF